ncbi:MAG: hypothetical protein Q8O19_03020, partial [Rectinemataceae bacterium]|nr:hypothetical protein [Rectinemataceae bacterium]
MSFSNSFFKSGKIVSPVFAVFLFYIAGLTSCQAGTASGFPWTGPGGGKLAFRQAVGFPLGAEGVFTGILRNNRYILLNPFTVSDRTSLKISVDCLVPGSVVQLMLSSRVDGGKSWASGQFLLDQGLTNIVLPFVPEKKLVSLELILQPEPGSTRAAKDQIFSIREVVVIKAFRGFL